MNTGLYFNSHLNVDKGETDWTFKKEMYITIAVVDLRHQFSVLACSTHIYHKNSVMCTFVLNVKLKKCEMSLSVLGWINFVGIVSYLF